MFRTPFLTAAALAMSFGFAAGVAEAGPQGNDRPVVVGTTQFAAGLQLAGDKRYDRRGRDFERRHGHGARDHHQRGRRDRFTDRDHHREFGDRGHYRRDGHHARDRHRAIKRKHHAKKRHHRAKKAYRHGYRDGYWHHRRHGYHRDYRRYSLGRYYHSRPWYRAWVSLRHLDFLYGVHPFAYRDLWLSHYGYYPDCDFYRPHAHGHRGYFGFSVRSGYRH